MAGSRKIMTADERNRRKTEVPQWTVGENKLARTYTFPDFQKGLDFVNRIGAVAEEQGHHPDIQLSWGKVVVETSTHDAGGITEQDFLLASKIDKLG